MTCYRSVKRVVVICFFKGRFAVENISVRVEKKGNIAVCRRCNMEVLYFRFIGCVRGIQKRQGKIYRGLALRQWEGIIKVGEAVVKGCVYQICYVYVDFT